MAIPQMLVRRDDTTVSLSPTVVNLLIALLSLSIVAVVAAIALISVRHFRARKMMQCTLPSHHHAGMSSMGPTLSPPTAQRSKRGHRRTVSITTAPMRHDLVLSKGSLDSEKDAFLHSPTTAPPRAGVPEIHITFPDEDRDSNEKRHSGRVVVVRISDNGGIGLAPYLEENNVKVADGLPEYSEFMSLDLEKLGGLREKKENVWA